MDTDTRKAFIKLLMECIANKGLKANSFAVKVGVSKAMMSRIVHGDRDHPCDEGLVKWADALGLSGVGRDRFLELGNLCHCPEDSQRRYQGLKGRLEAIQAMTSLGG